jgi:hypothetical protein
VGNSSTTDYDELTYNLNSQISSTVSTRTPSGTTVTVGTPRDALGRVTQRQVTGSSVSVDTITFKYDAQAKLPSALSAAGRGISLTDDELGRLKTRKDTVNTQTGSFSRR